MIFFLSDAAEKLESQSSIEENDDVDDVDQNDSGVESPVSKEQPPTTDAQDKSDHVTCSDAATDTAQLKAPDEEKEAPSPPTLTDSKPNASSSSLKSKASSPPLPKGKCPFRR